MSTLALTPTTEFASPDDTTAPAPPEWRGVGRDQVRLLVGTDSGIQHGRFSDLPRHLRAGDVVVVNNSATIPGEIDGRLGGRPVVAHVGSQLDVDEWVVELRTAPDAAGQILDASPGDRLRLSTTAWLDLTAPYPPEGSSPTGTGNRLWRARHQGPRPLMQHLLRHGRAISYGYLDQRYPLDAYQTVFAHEPGSSEMASAARPFTPELVTTLVRQGIGVAAITLHCGLSSQDAGEAPQPERFRVSDTTAAIVNAAKANGGRVIAVGTTVTRALESAVDDTGILRAAAGWTEHIVSAAEPPRVIDGLITGWHNPEASHLLLVEAVAGRDLTQRAYTAAVAEGYLWHEFGDSALLLPD